MHQDQRALRNVQNTTSQQSYVPLTHPYPAGNGGTHRGAAADPKAAALAAHHVLPGAYHSNMAETSNSGLPTKRQRVDDVLQQHAPREQLLVSELMGWRSSQEPGPGPGSLTGAGGAAGGIVVPKGSTDFRALFARPPSQQPPAQPQGPSAAAAGLRTFADVATRPVAGPEDVGRRDVLGAMRVAYNTASNHAPSTGRNGSQHPWNTQDPACPAPGGLGVATSMDGFGAAGGNAAQAGAAAGAQGGSGLEDLAPEQLPVDWGIKRSITFSSTARFAVHDRAQQALPRTRWRALQSVINCQVDSGNEEATQYMAGQISWRHPETPLDAAALAAAARVGASAGAEAAGAPAAAGPVTGTSGSASAGGLLGQRLAAWRNALHSLYGTYRGGDCNVFYILCSATRNPFTALFTYKGVRGCGELCAVVSQSTRLLRGRMLAAGVPFSMPLEAEAGPGAGSGAAAAPGPGPGGKAGYEAGPPADEPMDVGADVELCDEGAQAGPSSAAQVPGSTVPDNSRQSLLLLRGPRAVHGLYDFLVNETSYTGPGAKAGGGAGGAPADELNDLPLLLAPAPFEGGAVWRPCIKALTMSKTLGNGAATAKGAGGHTDPDPEAVTHVLQVSGPLPPWTVRRLLATLAACHPAGYSASMETEPSSITLNSRVVEPREGEGGAGAGQPWQSAFAQGGAVSTEEMAAWQQPVALPGGRPVKGVTCGSGRRLGLRV